jgi:hypothetical protein
VCLGRNTVSQREIQRCFTLIEFFWNLRYDDELRFDQRAYDPNPITCIGLAIALIYYFRLPTKDDNAQRKDTKTPSREQLAELLIESIPNFEQVIQHELYRFVNTDNFVIPQGVAINQAVGRLFSFLTCFIIEFHLDTRTYLCYCYQSRHTNTSMYYWRSWSIENLIFSNCSSKPSRGSIIT